MLGEVGIGHVDWEAGTLSSWFALSVMVMWRWTGYNALIYLAAMQAIPDELYEAAAIDGARPWQQFVHVTIPMLRPTIIFTVIISTIGGLQLFTEPYLFEPLKQRRDRRLGPPVPDGRHVPVREGVRRQRVQVRLRVGDRVEPVPADRRDLARQLPDRPPDPVGGADERARRQARAAGRRLAPPAPRARARSPTCSSCSSRSASIFPLYWSFVVASHDNSAVSAYPPVLTPGTSCGTTSRACSTRARSTSTSGRALVNSTIVAARVTVAVVFFSALAGFAFAKLEFRGSNALLLIVIVTR